MSKEVSSDGDTVRICGPISLDGGLRRTTPSQQCASTDLLLQRTEAQTHRGDCTLDGLLARLTVVAKEFAGFATRVEREARADEMVTNPRNGNSRSLGGVIAHVITHGMHHRAQVLYLLEQLGVKDVIEGDVLGWESLARGWGWKDGRSYGRPLAD